MAGGGRVIEIQIPNGVRDSLSGSSVCGPRASRCGVHVLELATHMNDDRSMTRIHDDNTGDDKPPTELSPEFPDVFAAFMDGWGRDMERTTRRWAEEPDALVIDLVENELVIIPPVPEEDL